MKIKPLGNLEEEIMNIVWELGTCSVRDVFEKISQTKQLAQTTVATILQRLYYKGLTKRIEKKLLYFLWSKIIKKSIQ